MNRKYASVKSDINSTLSELETHLEQAQFKKIKDSLNTKFQAAAPSSMQKKMKPNFQQQPRKPSKPTKKGWQGRRSLNQGRQLTMLLNGLNKLIQNKS